MLVYQVMVVILIRHENRLCLLVDFRTHGRDTFVSAKVPKATAPKFSILRVPCDTRQRRADAQTRYAQTGAPLIRHRLRFSALDKSQSIKTKESSVLKLQPFCAAEHRRIGWISARAV